MAEFQISAALARTLPRLMARADRERDAHFESGRGTRPATEAHLRHAAALAADRVVKQSNRRRPTSEEREKEIGRRRKWAGGGSMPPEVRAGYSEAERAALAVIADQCRRKGFCDLCLDEIARLAGVSRTSVQNALRKARSNDRAQITVRERPRQGGKSLTNIIKIVCVRWLGWISRAIGFKRLNTSERKERISLFEDAERVQVALEKGEETVFVPRLQSSRMRGSAAGSGSRIGWPKNIPDENDFGADAPLPPPRFRDRLSGFRS